MDKIKLYAYIETCLRSCAKDSDNKELWRAKAFGAVQYYCIICPEDKEEVAHLWSEKYNTTFTQIICGNIWTL